MPIAAALTVASGFWSPILGQDGADKAILEAVEQVEKGDLESASELLQELLRVAPDDPEANYYLGLILKRNGRKEEALGYLQRSASLGSSDPIASIVLGDTLVELGRPDEATRVIQKLPPESISEKWRPYVAQILEGDSSVMIDLSEIEIPVGPDPPPLPPKPPKPPKRESSGGPPD